MISSHSVSDVVNGSSEHPRDALFTRAPYFPARSPSIRPLFRNGIFLEKFVVMMNSMIPSKEGREKVVRKPAPKSSQTAFELGQKTPCLYAFKLSRMGRIRAQFSTELNLPRFCR